MANFPRWANAIVNRTQQNIENLILEFNEADWPFYEQFFNEFSIHSEELPFPKPGKMTVRIPFPVNDDCDTIEQMIDAFLDSFRQFLSDKYGDARPTDDTPS
jgi:hypothetical protein